MSETDKARSKMTPTSERTREQLLLAGERLFASQGLDNVSLRQINAEAGQRNSSAAHYHFGSKESLVDAIYGYRMARLDERRNRLLDALPPGDPPSIRALIGLLVQPIVDEIEDSEGGRHFIRFVAQLTGHPMVNLVSMWRNRLAGSLGRVYYDLRAALPDVPDEVFGPRFGLMWMLTVNALASRERLASSGNGLVDHALPVLFVDNLLDTLTGMISAPSSESTLAEVRTIRAGSRRRA